MPGDFQAAHAKNGRQERRRDTEQRAAAINRKQRLNQVRELEAGHKRRGRQGNFMSMIGYGFDDE